MTVYLSILSLVAPLHPLLLARQTGLSHLLQGLARVHDEGQGHGSGAVAALPGKAEEGGPEEGAAAHEGRSHVGRHQDEVQELRGQVTGSGVSGRLLSPHGFHVD